jgi:hypothetical protein
LLGAAAGARTQLDAGVREAALAELYARPPDRTRWRLPRPARQQRRAPRRARGSARRSTQARTRRRSTLDQLDAGPDRAPSSRTRWRSTGSTAGGGGCLAASTRWQSTTSTSSTRASSAAQVGDHLDQFDGGGVLLGGEREAPDTIGVEWPSSALIRADMLGADVLDVTAASVLGAIGAEAAHVLGLDVLDVTAARCSRWPSATSCAPPSGALPVVSSASRWSSVPRARRRSPSRWSRAVQDATDHLARVEG